MSIYLHLPGIEGDVSDRGHRGWLSVYQFAMASRRRIAARTATQGDRESANAELTDLTLTRAVDRASPLLTLEACCGTGKTARLHLGKTGSGDGADVFMEYTMHHAMVSSYALAASHRHGDRPMERLTISFTALAIRYIPYDQDGNALAPIAVGFDTATNQRL